jgi:hypothetical protein
VVTGSKPYSCRYTELMKDVEVLDIAGTKERIFEM